MRRRQFSSSLITLRREKVNPMRKICSIIVLSILASNVVGAVYVGDTQPKVPRPAKELKGFEKVSLRPGETKKVSVMLDSRALSYYDVNAEQWRADPGAFDVLVGRSSEQIELRGKLTVTGAGPAVAR